jgi:hypothetical protein
MKTTQEWFNLLKDDHKDKALKNMKNAKTEHYSLAGAISNGFTWEETPEGKDYWNKVFREVMYGEKFEQGIEVKKQTEPIQTPKNEPQTQPTIQYVSQNQIQSSTNQVEELIDENKSDNLFEQYKKETSNPVDNVVEDGEPDNLFKQYKLEQENYSK